MHENYERYNTITGTFRTTYEHDGQNRLSFQRQLFTADRSRNVVNAFCSRQMKSYKSANLITIKVPDTKIYLKTTNRGFLDWSETSSTVFSPRWTEPVEFSTTTVHSRQKSLRCQRLLFTTDEIIEISQSYKDENS